LLSHGLTDHRITLHNGEVQHTIDEKSNDNAPETKAKENNARQEDQTVQVRSIVKWLYDLLPRQATGGC